MSISTWRKTFLNVAVHEVPPSAAAATAHSLKKWRGLTTENLEKHNLKICLTGTSSVAIEDGRGNRLDIGSDNCALCQQFFAGCEGCSGCPIVQYRGYACDDVPDDDFVDAISDTAWGQFVEKGDPQPMISLLERTAIWVEQNNR